VRASSALAAFERGRSADSARYPVNSPAAPTNGWEFATLGEFIAALPPTPVRSTLHEIREIRNAMVHGHYVSWHTLEAVDACASALHKALQRGYRSKASTT
jgi:hypothetical protein